MPCPRPRPLRKTLATVSTGDFLSNLLSAAPRHPAPPISGRPKPLKSRIRNSEESLSPTLSPASFLNTIVNGLIAVKTRRDPLAVFALSKRFGELLLGSSSSIVVKLQFLLEINPDSPFAIIHAMVKSGCNLDSLTYSTLISGLCRVGRIEEAWRIVDIMVEDNCPPTVRCFTSIVLGYCTDGRVDEAKELIDEMRILGCHPDNVTYTILIHALCKRGNFDEVARVLGERELKGWKPDEVTFNVYMNGLCKAGKIDEAFRQLEVMWERGLSPTMESLHILFDCMCQLWKYKSLRKVSLLLYWDVDVFFYNTLMSRLCDIGWWQAVFQLWAFMVKRGVGSIYTFTIVIRSLCRKKMLYEAKYVFYSMGFQADVTAFNTLMFGLNMASKFREVEEIFLDMSRKNVTPNKFTYSIRIDSYCREQNFAEAVNCYFKSITSGFFPNLITRPIRWLIKDGKRREILNLFDEMVRRGFILDNFIFDSVIRGFCKKGLCRSAEESDIFYLIFDRMLRPR